MHVAARFRLIHNLQAIITSRRYRVKRCAFKVVTGDGERFCETLAQAYAFVLSSRGRFVVYRSASKTSNGPWREILASA